MKITKMLANKKAVGLAAIATTVAITGAVALATNEVEQATLQTDETVIEEVAEETADDVEIIAPEDMVEEQAYATYPEVDELVEVEDAEPTYVIHEDEEAEESEETEVTEESEVDEEDDEEEEELDRFDEIASEWTYEYIDSLSIEECEFYFLNYFDGAVYNPGDVTEMTDEQFADAFAKFEYIGARANMDSGSFVE